MVFKDVEKGAQNLVFNGPIFRWVSLLFIFIFFFFISMKPKFHLFTLKELEQQNQNFGTYPEGGSYYTGGMVPQWSGHLKCVHLKFYEGFETNIFYFLF